jgi:hypothetical protein
MARQLQRTALWLCSGSRDSTDATTGSAGRIKAGGVAALLDFSKEKATQSSMLTVRRSVTTD